MKRNKIFDCFTFFDENLLVNARFEILKDVVDFFIVCESKYDHKGNKKKINFKLLNNKFSKRVKHLIIETLPKDMKGWEAEKFQRESIMEALDQADDEDFIMYSDSDEIPNPQKIKNLNLDKKFGIFLQKFYVYKINIFNQYETPWEGTRICRKKNLKSFTHLRKKILKKNLLKPFWNIMYEKNIKIIEDGGWHFNNLYSFDKISKKLKTFPHTEFSSNIYSDLDVIKKKVMNLEDLFERGHKYKKCKINNDYPKYILKNLELFNDYIL